jgi:hypothetical protein
MIKLNVVLISLIFFGFIFYHYGTDGTIVYTGPLPHTQTTLKPYYYLEHEFKSDGYEWHYVRSIGDLKEELQTMQITRIIRTSRGKSGWYYIFVDDSQKKVVATGLTIRIKDDGIHAYRI